MSETEQWTDEEVFLIADLAHEIALQGRYPEALVLFDGLASIAPGNLYVRRALAAVHLKLGQPTAALAAIREQSTDGPSGRLRLECFLELGRRADAAREFQSIRARLEPPDRQRYALLLDNSPLPTPASASSQ